MLSNNLLPLSNLTFAIHSLSSLNLLLIPRAELQTKHQKESQRGGTRGNESPSAVHVRQQQHTRGMSVLMILWISITTLFLPAVLHASSVIVSFGIAVIVVEKCHYISLLLIRCSEVVAILLGKSATTRKSINIHNHSIFTYS